MNDLTRFSWKFKASIRRHMWAAGYRRCSMCELWREDIPINSRRCRPCESVRGIQRRDQAEPKTIYKRKPDKNREACNKYRIKNPQKIGAHLMVKGALLMGLINRAPCEICGESRSEAHHDDYAKPLDVRWLCRAHHRAVHRKHKSIIITRSAVN